MLRLIAHSLIGVLALGCSAKALNVGKTDDGPIDTNSPACQDAAAQIQLPDWPTPDGCVVGNEMASLVGVWEGYYQGTSIGDEKSTFRLTIIGANAQKGLCGTISFGTHTAAVAFPPPATDPAADYPPNSAAYNVDPALGMVYITLGLPYTVLDGKVDGQRVTFGYSVMEIFKSWCALQTPYPADSSCYNFLCPKRTRWYRSKRGSHTLRRNQHANGATSQRDLRAGFAVQWPRAASLPMRCKPLRGRRRLRHFRPSIQQRPGHRRCRRTERHPAARVGHELSLSLRFFLMLRTNRTAVPG